MRETPKFEDFVRLVDPCQFENVAQLGKKPVRAGFGCIL
jgi:hypothetical protein